MDLKGPPDAPGGPKITCYLSYRVPGRTRGQDPAGNFALRLARRIVLGTVGRLTAADAVQRNFQPFPRHKGRGKALLRQELALIAVLVRRFRVVMKPKPLFSCDSGRYPLPVLSPRAYDDTVTRYTQASILRHSRPAGKPSWLCLHTHCGFSVRCTTAGVSP